jgi:hypothetical protein
MSLIFFLLILVLVVCLSAGVVVLKLASSVLGGIGGFLKGLFFGGPELSGDSRSGTFSSNSDGIYEDTRPFRSLSTEGRRRMKVFKSMSESVSYEEVKNK